MFQIPGSIRATSRPSVRLGEGTRTQKWHIYNKILSFYSEILIDSMVREAWKVWIRQGEGLLLSPEVRQKKPERNAAKARNDPLLSPLPLGSAKFCSLFLASVFHHVSLSLPSVTCTFVSFTSALRRIILNDFRSVPPRQMCSRQRKRGSQLNAR